MSGTRERPDASGHFGPYGGRYIPETLFAASEELAQAYEALKGDESFKNELASALREFAGRPTPLFHAERLSDRVGASVYLKREDLCHTGAHKINNAVGQVLVAKRLKKKRVVAETGAGQHGVAVATVCARVGLPCVVYMGKTDMERQAPNVERMRLLGAEVRSVSSGNATLKEATSEAIRDWVTNVESTYYLLGSAVGMHPYPAMVRDFQRVIGDETIAQITHAEGRLPDLVVACVGGGSNAIGMFAPFLERKERVRMVGVEAGGSGRDDRRHAASLSRGSRGILHGALQYLLQDDDGQILETHSISAGLDYPGVGPEHAYLKDAGLVEYTAVSDEEALSAFRTLAALEGILPALESAHAIAYLLKHSASEAELIVVNLSGRGDKDLGIVANVQL
ncbi:MAG: tryptophan synthase beta chain [Bacteroidia bacterium]|nr:MAG: tryptophan synthase beta chain [Bacteroidia bacterium]